MTHLDRSIFIGLGCASAASAAEIIDLVDACLVEAGCDASQITALASHSRKRGSLALAKAADHFAVPLYFLADNDLAPGLRGTCEAVAASAGPLHLAKRKSRYATCAIALCASGDVAQPAITAMASATLPTSVAGA
jgi:cobalamin biosynthesis protein CbiG